MAAAARAFASNPYRRRVALLNAERKRRRSLAAIPKIHQTRRIPADIGAPVPVDEVLPAGAVGRPITFAFELEVTDPAPDGTILNVGNADPALTLFYDGGVLRLVAGSGSSSASAVQATATRPHAGAAGLPGRFQIVVSVRPGDGHARVWDEHGLLAQGEAAGGGFAAWAGAGEDLTAFAAAAGPNGLVANPGAPSGFSPAGPIRVFALYVPQHFLSNIPDEVVFDDFLFNATTINFQLAKFPLLDDSEP